MRGLRFLRRLFGNFWYYYVGRQRFGYGRFPIGMAVVLAYDHTTHFSRDRYAHVQNPAWGGKVSDFDD